MRQKYGEEKKNHGGSGATPSKWPWYEFFDNMLRNTTKSQGVPHGVDQGICMPHQKIHDLSDEDGGCSSEATPIQTNSSTPSSPCMRETTQPHCVGQVNKSA